jgi:GT2 family glycosyltransferase
VHPEQAGAGLQGAKSIRDNGIGLRSPKCSRFLTDEVIRSRSNIAMTHPEAPSVSLVVATLGRYVELRTLFESLAAQRSRDFEVVLVDQNDDEMLSPLVTAYRASFPIVHAACAPGLSRARNAGVAIASGGIIGFPDDDCSYDAATVARAIEFFTVNPQADGLTGRGVQVQGQRPHARFDRAARWVTAGGVWTQGISYTLFVRRALVRRVGAFDEQLGLGSGTAWPAAEEADYLLRALSAGARIWYDPSFTVHHPGSHGDYSATLIERGRRYGCAMGYVLRKHHRSRFELAYHLLRPGTGALLAVSRGRFGEARYHAAVAKGRWQGWRDGRRTFVPAHTAEAAGIAPKVSAGTGMDPSP